MVILLLIVFLVISIVGIGIYFWQRATPEGAGRMLPPPPDFRGLFHEDSSTEINESNEAAREREASLLARARKGERSVLAEAQGPGETELYERLLSELAQHADSDEKLLSLMSYVGTNEFRVNNTLASAVLAAWQKSPDRHGTSKALHFAALSDDANLFQDAVEQALRLWQEGKLPGVSASELRALFDGEFWILSSRTRSSGAGFVLKRTLDSARRELEAAASANQ